MYDFKWDEPTAKAPQIEALLLAVTGKDRVATIRSHKCMTCDQPLACRTCNAGEVNHKGHEFMPFRDIGSAREYTISGTCQHCQDAVFGMEDN